jgi:hypothetical protein
MSRERSGRKIVAESISHYLIGMALVMKGIVKAEHFGFLRFSVLFVIAAGAFIILGAVFQRSIEKRIRNFTALFHVAEGIALGLIGLLLLEESTRLPYFLFFIGLMYLAVGIFLLFTDPAGRKRLAPRFAAVMGWAFLLFAATAVVLNTLHARNGWAYFTAGLMVVMGVFLLVARRRLFHR